MAGSPGTGSPGTGSPGTAAPGLAPALADGPDLDQLIAGSPSLSRSLAGIDRAAASPSPILVLGEPGTGRSSLARAIHRSSPRSSGELVEVDPGAVPSTLFESDLFGYRAGAFTGAEESMEGRVERARGGTLVLDHVEELPLVAQPKLLRLLAELRYTPLGGRERPADVRFVALALPDLPERVEKGAFRADLYYRLEVLAFRLPPLRDRLDDLPSLVDGLLADLCARLDRPRPRIAEPSLRWMQRYAWPGNLRQLRNVLERALVRSPGEGLIEPEPPRDARAPRPVTLAELEKQHILDTLAHTRGHQGRAAELLGISRKALWEKRRRYDLP